MSNLYFLKLMTMGSVPCAAIASGGYLGYEHVYRKFIVPTINGTSKDKVEVKNKANVESAELTSLAKEQDKEKITWARVALEEKNLQEKLSAAISKKSLSKQKIETLASQLAQISGDIESHQRILQKSEEDLAIDKDNKATLDARLVEVGNEKKIKIQALSAIQSLNQQHKEAIKSTAKQKKEETRNKKNIQSSLDGELSLIESIKLQQSSQKNYETSTFIKKTQTEAAYSDAYLAYKDQVAVEEKVKKNLEEKREEEQRLKKEREAKDLEKNTKEQVLNTALMAKEIARKTCNQAIDAEQNNLTCDQVLSTNSYDESTKTLLHPYQELMAKYDIAEEDVEDIKDELFELKTQIDEVEKLINQYTGKLVIETEKTKQLLSASQAAKAASDEAKNNYEKAQNASKETEKNYQKSLKNLEVLREKLDETTNLLVKTTAKLDGLNAKIPKMNADEKEAADSLAAITTEETEVKGNLKTLKNKIWALEGTITFTTQALSNKQEEQKAKNIEKEENLKKLKEAEDVIEETTPLLNSAQETLVYIASEVDEIKSDVTTLTAKKDSPTTLQTKK